MSYNILLNSSLSHNNSNWKTINCTLVDNIITSTNKVFGIEQELTLPDMTTLYFRVVYKALNSIKNVKIGIQNGDVLEVNTQLPKLNKLQKISIVDRAKQETIKLHIIFESDTYVNKVHIKEPLLVDLNHLNKSTWTKGLLDKVLKYRAGYTYNNLFDFSELTSDVLTLNSGKLSEAKIGSILTTKDSITFNLPLDTKKNHFYLIKLDYENINNFGKVGFRYGFLKSKDLLEQSYIIFKATDSNIPTLNIEAGDIIEYKVNLKHLMAIDITDLNLLQEDIEKLPFI